MSLWKCICAHSHDVVHCLYSLQKLHWLLIWSWYTHYPLHNHVPSPIASFLTAPCLVLSSGTSRGLGESPEEGPALILALDLQVQERTATLPQPPITPRKRYPAGDTPLHALGPHRGPARGPGPGPDVNRGGIRRHRGERRLCFWHECNLWIICRVLVLQLRFKKSAIAWFLYSCLVEKWQSMVCAHQESISFVVLIS